MAFSATEDDVEKLREQRDKFQKEYEELGKSLERRMAVLFKEDRVPFNLWLEARFSRRNPEGKKRDNPFREMFGKMTPTNICDTPGLAETVCSIDDFYLKGLFKECWAVRQSYREFERKYNRGILGAERVNELVMPVKY